MKSLVKIFGLLTIASMLFVACPDPNKPVADVTIKDISDSKPDYEGIVISIDNPVSNANRRIYVNEKVTGWVMANLGYEYSETEWGYPFVTPGKNYEVYVTYEKDGKLVATSNKVVITAKSGIGELKITSLPEASLNGSMVSYKKQVEVKVNGVKIDDAWLNSRFEYFFIHTNIYEANGNNWDWIGYTDDSSLILPNKSLSDYHVDHAIASSTACGFGWELNLHTKNYGRYAYNYPPVSETDDKPESDTPGVPDGHPMTYILDLADSAMPEKITFSDNSQYGDAGKSTRQVVVDFTSFVKSNTPQVGDKITVTGKIISPIDIDNLLVSIVDDSAAANYWTLLGMVGNDNKVYLENIKKDVPYELNFTFTIVEAVKENVKVQLAYGEQNGEPVEFTVERVKKSFIGI